MMKKICFTFLLCCYVFKTLAEVELNKPTCIVPGDPNVYQTIYNPFNSTIFRLEAVADVQPAGGFPCTETGQITWVPTKTCKVRNTNGSIYLNGEYGTFQLLECPIDDYVPPMAMLVIGFAYYRLNKRWPVG